MNGAIKSLQSFLRVAGMLGVALGAFGCGASDEDVNSVASTLITGFGGCPPFSDDQACACSDANFHGTCVTLNGGTHFYPTSSQIGLPDNWISSLVAGGGVNLRYCVDSEMRGTCATLVGRAGGAPLAVMSGSPGNDSVSSMRVDRKTDNCFAPMSNQVSVFLDANFLGDCAVLTLPFGVGLADYPSTSGSSTQQGLSGSFGLPNDAVSSLIVGSGVRAVLSHDGALAGQQAYYDGNRLFFPTLGGVNDVTSSMQVFVPSGGPIAATFVGDYPSNGQPIWAEGVQGIAHNADSWFIAQTTTISVIRFTTALAGASVVRTIGRPPAVASLGYDHFGDPDVRGNFLLVPMQKKDGTMPPALAVFTADDNMTFLGFTMVPNFPTDGGAWVAYRPSTDTLFLSDGDIGGTKPILEYSLDWNLLPSGIVSLNLLGAMTLTDRNGVPMQFSTVQGGVFNPGGTLLYLDNGYCDRDEGSIFIFDMATGKLQARSENAYGPFNFEHHGGTICDEEPEGMDFLDSTGRGMPGIPNSQLHVLLLRNALGSDGVYLKHYGF